VGRFAADAEAACGTKLPSTVMSAVSAILLLTARLPSAVKIGALHSGMVFTKDKAAILV
jgi:hypothetical protein